MIESTCWVHATITQRHRFIVLQIQSCSNERELRGAFKSTSLTLKTGSQLEKKRIALRVWFWNKRRKPNQMTINDKKASKGQVKTLRSTLLSIQLNCSVFLVVYDTRKYRGLTIILIHARMNAWRVPCIKVLTWFCCWFHKTRINNVCSCAIIQ